MTGPKSSIVTRREMKVPKNPLASWMRLVAMISVRAAHPSTRLSLLHCARGPGRIIQSRGPLEDRERQVSDQTLVRWIYEQVERRGLRATAELLHCDAANLSKVPIPARLRERVNALLS